jgi:hypothetical protein
MIISSTQQLLKLISLEQELEQIVRNACLTCGSIMGMVLHLSILALCLVFSTMEIPTPCTYLWPLAFPQVLKSLKSCFWIRVLRGNWCLHFKDTTRLYPDLSESLCPLPPNQLDFMGFQSLVGHLKWVPVSLGPDRIGSWPCHYPFPVIASLAASCFWLFADATKKA